MKNKKEFALTPVPKSPFKRKHQLTPVPKMEDVNDNKNSFSVILKNNHNGLSPVPILQRSNPKPLTEEEIRNLWFISKKDKKTI